MTDISLSTDLVAFPSPLKRGGKGATYMIKPGSVIERELFEAELAARWRAPRVYHFQLCDALADGVRAIADKEDQPRLLDLIQRSRNNEALDPSEQAVLAETERLMSSAWPEFAILQERQIQRSNIYPLVAFLWFVKGWEGVPGDIVFTIDGKVDESALAHVDPIDLKLAGQHAYNLLYASGEEKNSAALSASEEAPATSISASASPADGKSTGRSGTKTRN